MSPAPMPTSKKARAAGYPVSISIKDIGGSSASASDLIKIVDSPLDMPTGLTITVPLGTALTNKVLGSFRDQDSLNTVPVDYTGSINWGDSTKSSATFALTGSTFNVGSYWNVMGSHTYTKKGVYSVTITLHDNGSPTVSLIITATVKVV